MPVRYYRCDILPPEVIEERGEVVSKGSYRPAIATHSDVSWCTNGIPVDRDGKPTEATAIIVAETEDWSSVEADSRCVLLEKREEQTDRVFGGKPFRARIKHRVRGNP